MTDQNELSALRRKAGAGRAPSDGAGMTPAKAFRLAVSKAAEVELGLPTRVTAIKEEQLTQAQLLETLDGEALLLMLEGPQDGKGVAVFDLQALSAVIEVQTLGQVIGAEAKARTPTRTDSAMCEALLDRILQEFEGHLLDGSSAEWATGFRFDKRIANLRLMGLALEDIVYRVFHLQLDLADGAKRGVLQIALPADGVRRKKAGAGGDDGWAQAMENVVGDSRVEILAVLHRVHKSLAEVQTMQVGDEIILPKSSISAVSMEGMDGCFVGVARLGQQNGHRALRISAAQAEPALTAGAVGDPVADLPAPGLGSEMGAMDMAPPPAPMALPGSSQDAPFPAVDMPMPTMEGQADVAPMGDLPDLPMAPMGDLPDLPMAPMGDLPDLPMAPMDGIDDMPMAAPMDIEIA